MQHATFLAHDVRLGLNAPYKIVPWYKVLKSSDKIACEFGKSEDEKKSERKYFFCPIIRLSN